MANDDKPVRFTHTILFKNRSWRGFFNTTTSELSQSLGDFNNKSYLVIKSPNILYLIDPDSVDTITSVKD